MKCGKIMVINDKTVLNVDFLILFQHYDFRQVNKIYLLLVCSHPKLGFFNNVKGIICPIFLLSL